MSPSRPPERARKRAAHGGTRGAEDRAVPAAGPVACPHCGSAQVEVMAPFGSQLMTAQYWCLGCRTVFERMKVDPDDDPGRWLES